MRRIIAVGVVAIVVLLLIAQFGPAWFARGHANGLASPLFGVTIPEGYRDWKMIAVAHEAGLDELRGVLGNDVAVKAYQDGTLPFPDGTILAKLAWKHVPVPGLNGAFVTGPATTVQIMVKDSKRYASTGGWGFGRFIEGKPVNEAQHRTCVPCHEANVKGHDLVFTRFAR
jgi:Cytochrome P460